MWLLDYNGFLTPQSEGYEPDGEVFVELTNEPVNQNDSILFRIGDIKYCEVLHSNVKRIK